MDGSESQALEGYGCICGFTTEDMKVMRLHLLQAGHKEPGVHKSKGRINLVSGEVMIPKWTERTKEEKKQTSYKVSREPRKDNTAPPPNRLTEDAGVATEIRIVPRIFTIDFTPIMRAARVATEREWRWNPAMPWTNWFDTVIYHFLKDHGITLNTYTVAREPESEEPQEEDVAQPQDERDLALV